MANSNTQPTPTFASTFINQPVLGWAIDDFEQLYEIFKNLSSTTDYLKGRLDGYTDSFNSISMLFDSAPINLNLGGATEKSKLVPTDKSIGVFDFSLASRGLYRVPEYYSEKLAQEKPDRFVEFELPSGVIPPNFVKSDVLLGNKIFYYEEGGVKYNCIIRQKGETDVELGVKGAKLKFATRTRKVYLTYKRNKGKVKYVEIYSLFYYTNLSGDVQYAIRHIPTQKWVWFGNEEIEVTVSTIILVDFKECLISDSKGYLEMFLRTSVFNKTPNYGNDNFLEFEFVKIKTTYTIES
jgi:hypothetical protein